MIKKSLAAGALTLGLLAPSCLGPNNAVNSLSNWNAEVTDMDWLNEVIFLGMTIIPVYGLAWVGDVLIFNTMNYWGENPIDAPAEFPEGFHSGE
jgi:hypothetical protein